MASGLLLLACQPDIRPSDSNQVKGAADGASWNTENFFETATVEEVTDFLEGGADLEARTGVSGATPLHRAVGFNDLAVIAALLEAGANLELRTDQGLTPLHVAVGFNKNPAIIAALLEAGANLEARTDRDWTPMHAATSSNENPVVVAALLDAGADPNARTKEGETARQLASDNEALSNTDVYWRLAHATEDDRAGPSGVSFFDRFDLDVILNIAAGVILAGVVLGVLYFIFWCVFMFIAANR